MKVLPIVIIGFILIATTAFFLSSLNQQAMTQTASATTDYFSLSCQDLQHMVNQRLSHFDTAYNSFANGLLQIMQLKGCSVSP